MTASIPLRIWNCLSTEIIRYSIVLEILLEMRFCAAVGVPKKSGVARLSGVFATAVLANFQDRLVMTTSITLRRVSLAKCSGIWREFRERTMKFLYVGKCRKPLILQGFWGNKRNSYARVFKTALQRLPQGEITLRMNTFSSWQVPRWKSPYPFILA